MADADGPVRTCIGCRGRGARDTLVRYVLAHDPAAGDVVVRDDGRQLPGRGAWLHDDPACRQRAVKRRALRRALRAGSSAGELGFPEHDDADE